MTHKTFFKSDYVWNKPPKESKAKVQKPIPQISEKKKERIKTEGSETDVFKKVWNERPHSCVMCGKLLKEPKAHNFDHIKGKGMNKKLRNDPSNIQILCFACHYEKTTGQKYKGINLD